MSKAVKIKIYKKMMKPAAVFGGETWAVAEMDETIQVTGEMKILGICGAVGGTASNMENKN
jgi:hypothetical protein